LVTETDKEADVPQHYIMHNLIVTEFSVIENKL